ncbi:cis-3-alkyl-4-alkyloxetan-2-one decarboxylase [Salvia divinorum]|uniref:Cis-3-alkyl-4-alkyloxetan-2-one decarboxylase n=1 Tax=Salvia divinorum TaxID=28513 RepID=A0ABD1I9G1_SALDI
MVGSHETIVFLHGAPTQSYSYRAVMSQMSVAASTALHPTFSDKPQAGYGLDYTGKEFHEVFDKLLDTLDVTEPFYLVVQGIVVGLTWALKNQSRVSKLAILNTPLTTSSPFPWLFQQLSFYAYLND